MLVEEDDLTGNQPAQTHQFSRAIQFIRLEKLSDILFSDFHHSNNYPFQRYCLERNMQLVGLRNDHAITHEPDIRTSVVFPDFPCLIFRQ